MKVLHLVGSPTDDFYAELSRLYAADCLRSLHDPDRWQPIIAYVAPDGRWRFPASLDAEVLTRTPSVPIEDAIARLRQLAPDLAVPQMFCVPGMTTYRALLDALDIPYVGNRPDVMAIGARKPLTKAIAAAAGVAVPHGTVVARGESLEASVFALPIIVKPADADNSDGLTLVREPGELDAALERAWQHSADAVVESYVELGREVRCGVLDTAGGLVGLPLEEYAVDPQRKPIRDAADKLARRDGLLTLVAKSEDRAWIVPADDPVTAVVQDAAKLAHRALGCRHYSLFDFRVDPAGVPWLLEAGLYCSFASTSVVATMAAAAGITVRKLFAAAVDVALADRCRTSLFG